MIGIAAGQERNANAPAAERVDILLVDDQPEGLLALEAILGPLGQNLVRASSGRDALRQILAHDFAVILLDVQMPGMDGYETAGLIRERVASRLTPLIFLTASSKADVQMLRGYSVGAVDYLFKPIDAEVLRSKVTVFVELAKQASLIRQQADELSAREREAQHLANLQAQLLHDLEIKHRDLEVAHEELESFSYSVSHDLRAPLRAIAGFTQALAAGYGERLDDDGKAYVQRVINATKHMGDLIEGLLGLAKVSREDLRWGTVDLSQLAREVAAGLQSQVPERRAEFVIADGLSTKGDSRLLRGVMENLLDNAWKFTRRRPDARIEVGQELHEGAPPTFFIRDNGAGFDMAHATRLFGTFQRLHPASEFEGYGIGLATVQRIVRRHGGSIRAEAQVGVGATFFFTLAPSAAPTVTTAPPADSGAASASGPPLETLAQVGSLLTRTS